MEEKIKCGTHFPAMKEMRFFQTDVDGKASELNSGKTISFNKGLGLSFILLATDPTNPNPNSISMQWEKFWAVLQKTFNCRLVVKVND